MLLFWLRALCVFCGLSSVCMFFPSRGPVFEASLRRLCGYCTVLCYAVLCYVMLCYAMLYCMVLLRLSAVGNSSGSAN